MGFKFFRNIPEGILLAVGLPACLLALPTLALVIGYLDCAR
ncbi:hypothetical protein [Trinickia acidisoli]|nr:hypothetical protein [Trinickia acidisoli]